MDAPRSAEQSNAATKEFTEWHYRSVRRAWFPLLSIVTVLVVATHFLVAPVLDSDFTIGAVLSLILEATFVIAYWWLLSGSAQQRLSREDVKRWNRLFAWDAHNNTKIV